MLAALQLFCSLAPPRLALREAVFGGRHGSALGPVAASSSSLPLPSCLFHRPHSRGPLPCCGAVRA